MSDKKPSLFSRLLSRGRRKRTTELTPEHIRRKLEGYQKTDGPADFGTARLYTVQEADEALAAEILQRKDKPLRKS